MCMRQLSKLAACLCESIDSCLCTSYLCIQSHNHAWWTHSYHFVTLWLMHQEKTLCPSTASGSSTCLPSSSAFDVQDNELSVCIGSKAWPQALALRGESEALTALAHAAALSVRSTHPVSQAVVTCAQSAGSSLPQLQLHDFRQQPGAPSVHVCMSATLRSTLPSSTACLTAAGSMESQLLC